MPCSISLYIVEGILCCQIMFSWMKIVRHYCMGDDMMLFVELFEITISMLQEAYDGHHAFHAHFKNSDSLPQLIEIDQELKPPHHPQMKE